MLTSMSIKFTPTKDDYIKTLRANSFGAGNIWLNLLIFCIVFAAITVVLLLSHVEFWVVAPVFIAALIFYVFFQYVMNPLRISQQVQSNERFRSEVTWTVDESGVLLANKFGESKSDWGTFYNFKETKEHFLVYYSTNRDMFQIVPKRAFESAGQLEAFRHILTVNLAQARSQGGELAWLAQNRWKLMIYVILVIFCVIVFLMSYNNMR